MKMHSSDAKRFLAPLVALLVGGLAGAVAAETPSGMVSAGKLAKDAKKFYGQTVTVKAEVEDIFDSRTFTLDEDAILAGADVLVIVPSGITAGLKENEVVMVTGKVRPFVTAEFEKEWDWFKDGKLVVKTPEVDLETRPVIVATMVKTGDGRDLMGPNAAMVPVAVKGDKVKSDHAHTATQTHSATTHTATTTAPAAGMMLTAGKLAREGKTMYGQKVTVRAEVEDVYDTHTFSLDEDSMLAGPDVLVLVPGNMGATALRHDQWVTVSGTVRPYVVQDLERDYDFFKNGKIVSKGVKVDFQTRPVLVADSIRTADGKELIVR